MSLVQLQDAIEVGGYRRGQPPALVATVRGQAAQQHRRQRIGLVARRPPGGLSADVAASGSPRRLLLQCFVGGDAAAPFGYEFGW